MDYLEHFRRASVFQKLDMKDIPVATITGLCKSRLDAYNGNKIVPESAALEFYLGNHVSNLISQRYSLYEPLGDAEPLIRGYLNSMGELGLRMTYYLLLICTRETRHVRSGSPSDDWVAAYGPKCWDFTSSINNESSSGAVSAILQYPPNIPITVYADYLVDVFKDGKFGSSFGGEPWAQVARCLADFVNGRTTLEMMLDTSFTLAHNNGPIFNKGIIFSMYDMSSTTTILDVQRSGQIPNLISEMGTYSFVSNYVTDKVGGVFETAKELFPELGEPIDWFVVEELGSESKYPTFKNTQTALHGASTKLALAQKNAEDAAKAAAAVEAKKLAEYEDTHYEVISGVYVRKINREVLHGKAA